MTWCWIWVVCVTGPPLKSAFAQRKSGYGSILHYIYQSTLGQSLHSQMRQVRLLLLSRQRGTNWLWISPLRLYFGLLPVPRFVLSEIIDASRKLKELDSDTKPDQCYRRNRHTDYCYCGIVPARVDDITWCQQEVVLCCLLQCLQEPFVRSLSSYHFHGATSPFDRRITCLEWHPTHPTTMAVGSKGGDLYMWDFEVPTKKAFVQGVSFKWWSGFVLVGQFWQRFTTKTRWRRTSCFLLAKTKTVRWCRSFHPVSRIVMFHVLVYFWWLYSDKPAFVFLCTERCGRLYWGDEVLSDGPFQSLCGFWWGHIDPAELWGSNNHRSVQNPGLRPLSPQCLVKKDRCCCAYVYVMLKYNVAEIFFKNLYFRT